MKKTARAIRPIDPASPKAPPHLSVEARNWWYEICADWNFEAADLLILESALEAFDRCREAQEILKKQGIVIRDRYGVQKVHPASSIERDMRQMTARLFKALHLNTNPIKEKLGRPPGTR